MEHLRFNDRWKIAIATNVATNGRWFCALVFVACIAAFLKDGDHFWIALSILAATPIGLACMADRAAGTWFGSALAVFAYAVSIAVAALVFVITILR